ncbi:hypothetical protein AZE42_12571, partial [Rhizopogon vesiculosus]
MLLAEILMHLVSPECPWNVFTMPNHTGFELPVAIISTSSGNPLTIP